MLECRRWQGVRKLHCSEREHPRPPERGNEATQSCVSQLKTNTTAATAATASSTGGDPHVAGAHVAVVSSST